MCEQEQRDLDAVVKVFARDALCFAAVSTVAGHLPFPLRLMAMEAARGAMSKVSEDGSSGDGATGEEGSGADGSVLPLERFNYDTFAMGSLTNLAQIVEWSIAPNAAVRKAKEKEQDEDAYEDGEERGKDWQLEGLPYQLQLEGLPYHQSFLDAAVLTLGAVRWPLLVDPEGMALRWLAGTYGAGIVLPPIPAAHATLAVVSTVAERGAILAVNQVHSGVHHELALFLSSPLRVKP
ncbi:unnamed protein product, partial [Chrysoparadoxa australica]